MKRAKPAAPPSAAPAGLLELDHFSSADLTRWQSLSADLDQFQALLYFGPMPERRRRHSELVDALQRVTPQTIELTGWCRVTTWRYSSAPLSAAGSLHGPGGRFNAGSDLDPDTLQPWPALYVAEDHETAMREKFSMAASDRADGLTREELALSGASSYTNVTLVGSVTRAFDASALANLHPVAMVLARIKPPAGIAALRRRLHLPPMAGTMIRNAKQLKDNLEGNWRVLPMQFGLPAASHVFADLVRSAGFDAIVYRSTKGAGRCVAIFPDRIAPNTWVELRDEPPESVVHRRLDADSAEALCGWNTLTRIQRSAR